MCTARLTSALRKTLRFDWRAVSSVILWKGQINRHLSDTLQLFFNAFLLLCLCLGDLLSSAVILFGFCSVFIHCKL